MIKRILPFLLLLSLVAVPASAQSGLALFGSYWDGGEVGKATGWGLRATYTWKSQWGLDLTSNFMNEFRDIDQLKDVGDVFPLEVKMNALDFGGHRRFGGEGLVSGWVGLGLSWYRFTPNFNHPMDDQFGYYGNLGLEIGRRHVRFMVEGSYRAVDATLKYRDVDLVFDPDSPLDLKIEGPAVIAGIMIRP